MNKNIEKVDFNKFSAMPYLSGILELLNERRNTVGSTKYCYVSG